MTRCVFQCSAEPVSVTGTTRSIKDQATDLSEMDELRLSTDVVVNILEI